MQGCTGNKSSPSKLFSKFATTVVSTYNRFPFSVERLHMKCSGFHMLRLTAAHILFQGTAPSLCCFLIVLTDSLTGISQQMSRLPNSQPTQKRHVYQGAELLEFKAHAPDQFFIDTEYCEFERSLACICYITRC